MRMCNCLSTASLKAPLTHICGRLSHRRLPERMAQSPTRRRLASSEEEQRIGATAFPRPRSPTAFRKRAPWTPEDCTSRVLTLDPSTFQRAASSPEDRTSRVLALLLQLSRPSGKTSIVPPQAHMELTVGTFGDACRTVEHYWKPTNDLQTNLKVQHQKHQGTISKRKSCIQDALRNAFRKCALHMFHDTSHNVRALS